MNVKTNAKRFLLGVSLFALTAVGGLAAPVSDLTPRFPPGARILFQGDSITDGGRGYGDDPNHVFGQDYAYLIAARCGAHYPEKNWTFLNRGVSGNKVTDLAGRWQGDALDLKPDILSILVGVNDAASGDSAEQYERVYDQILQQALAANPNVRFVLGEPFIAQTGHVLENPIRWNAEIQKRRRPWSGWRSSTTRRSCITSRCSTMPSRTRPSPSPSGSGTASIPPMPGTS